MRQKHCFALVLVAHMVSHQGQAQQVRMPILDMLILGVHPVRSRPRTVQCTPRETAGDPKFCAIRVLRGRSSSVVKPQLNAHFGHVRALRSTHHTPHKATR